MTHFREKWVSKTKTPLHSSNPQPFTLGELEELMGEPLLTLSADTVLGYGSDLGYQPLRQAVSGQLYPDLHSDNLLTTTGAQEGIYISMHALLNRGDKVIAFTPIFEPLIATAQRIGCAVELLPLDSNNSWQIDLQRLEESIDDKTRMVIINYPHNPTGSLLSKEALEAIIALCRQHDVWLFSDEVFRGLEHKPEDRLPAAAEHYEKGISLGVLSKSFGLPTIRVGWLACQNQAFLKQCKTVRSYLSICNDQLGERAATVVVQHSEAIFDYYRQHLLANYALLDEFKRITPEIDFYPAKGGCTVFAKLAVDSEQLAEKLVKETGLLVIPNQAFCTAENAVRLGFGNVDYEKHLAMFSSVF